MPCGEVVCVKLVIALCLGHSDALGDRCGHAVFGWVRWNSPNVNNRNGSQRRPRKTSRMAETVFASLDTELSNIDRARKEPPRPVGVVPVESGRRCPTSISASRAPIGCETEDEIQGVLDTWFDGYNHRRPHQGRGTNGRTPAQAFKDGLPKPQLTKGAKNTGSQKP